ncbi:MAG: hypothetical protein ACRDTA_13345 [Pseudonocardiaceae bacterium]
MLLRHEYLREAARAEKERRLRILASFLFLLVLNASRLFLDAREKRMFRAFFGNLTESSQVVFVYPDFELTAPQLRRSRTLQAHLLEAVKSLSWKSVHRCVTNSRVE